MQPGILGSEPLTEPVRVAGEVVGCQAVSFEIQGFESGIYRNNEFHQKVVGSFRGTPRLGFESREGARFRNSTCYSVSLCISFEITKNLNY